MFHKTSFEYFKSTIQESMSDDHFKPGTMAQKREQYIRIFSSLNRYITAADTPPDWANNWNFFDIVSFKIYGAPSLGISITDSKILLVYFDGIYRSQFDHKFCSLDVNFNELAVETEKQISRISNFLDAGIRFANRSRSTEEFTYSE